jgi:hypothetical protein
VTAPSDHPTDEQLTAAREIIREYDQVRLAGTGPLNLIDIDDLLNALDAKLDEKFSTPDMWRLLNLIGELMNDPDILTDIETTWIEFQWLGNQDPLGRPRLQAVEEPREDTP